MLLWGALAGCGGSVRVVLLVRLYASLEKEKEGKGAPTGFTSEEEVGTESSDHWGLADQ